MVTKPYQDTWASAAYMLRRHRCQMAFESDDGREIPTEAITQGLFWELMDQARDALGDIPHDSPVNLAAGIQCLRALLAKLEPQK